MLNVDSLMMIKGDVSSANLQVPMHGNISIAFISVMGDQRTKYNDEDVAGGSKNPVEIFKAAIDDPDSDLNEIVDAGWDVRMYEFEREDYFLLTFSDQKALDGDVSWGELYNGSSRSQELQGVLNNLGLKVDGGNVVSPDR
ncbi:MAG: hypothetical protein ACI9Y1_002956 [Lentisphaeria bacterium]|jgi:hypothetical protein